MVIILEFSLPDLLSKCDLCICVSVEKLGESIAEKGKVDRELHENACCV